MKKNTIHILIGPILFLSCIAFLPESIFTTFEMRAAIGTVAWMAYWWVSSCMDYAVTGFLPIAINAIIEMTSMSSVIANYASETILLLLGASILTVSWEEVELDKRIAYVFLGLIGSSLTSQIIFWFVLSVAMSAVLPNAIVCATVVPIAVSMLRYIGIENINKSEVGSILLLTIAWGAGLGGLASPLGGAMNLVVVDYIEQYTGSEFMYIDWVIKFFPVMIVLIVSNLAFLLVIKPKNIQLEGSKAYFVEKNKELGKMSKNEAMCLLLFVIATILSFTRSFYEHLLPGLEPAYIFIICALISFLFKKENGEKLMVWKNVQKKIVWELIYVFAGGLAVGTLINGSGAAQALGNLLSTVQFQNEMMLVFVIIALTIVLSDLTSNTATAAVAIPIVLSLALALNLNPIPYMLAASVGVNLSYCMPTSIRAIPVGYGLNPQYMFKHGIKLTVIVVLLMTVVVWALMTYIPSFSILI
ncbi:SLC13 family permease [Tannockella kyphosi]|uniref:SLC13 family permease n=1 Tax=Tannockella kyphosi TaxID=2899121 RepID=UPI00201267D8|nr:SLC13 family permease [Tannockella kyphosi]